jgi:hypothetical protein
MEVMGKVMATAKYRYKNSRVTQSYRRKAKRI